MKNHLVASMALFVITFFCCKAPEVKATPEVKPEVVVAEEPVKTAIIEYKTADWCPPCRAFHRGGAKEGLEKSGWTFVKNDDLEGGYPSFRVWVDGKSSTFAGYSSRSAFYRTIKSITAKLRK